MTEVGAGTASEAALAWLDGLVSNTGDPMSDAGVWVLSHESLRADVIRELGLADVDTDDDITALDDWQDLAHRFVVTLRARLPPNIQALGLGDAIGKTGLELPIALDHVEVVFKDGAITEGEYAAAPGTRVGFALTAVHDIGTGWWTVAGIHSAWIA